LVGWAGGEHNICDFGVMKMVFFLLRIKIFAGLRSFVIIILGSLFYQHNLQVFAHFRKLYLALLYPTAENYADKYGLLYSMRNILSIYL
jgi:hypothetical protein